MEFLATQTINFVLVIIIGLLIGVFFDVYRVLRKLFPSTRSAISLLDLIWWLLVTFSVFLILLWCNRGEVRFYLFVGLAVGLFLYFRILSRTCLLLLSKSFFWLFTVINKTFHLLMIPLRIGKRLIVWLIAAMGFVIFSCMKGCRGCFSFFKKIIWAIPRRIGRNLKKFFQKKKP